MIGGTAVTTALATRSTSGIVTGRTRDSEGSDGSGVARGGGGAVVCIDRSCLGGAVYDASVEGPESRRCRRGKVDPISL
jgi:hypothetical protein